MKVPRVYPKDGTLESIEGETAFPNWSVQFVALSPPIVLRLTEEKRL
jgi:hypothetical protein